jgi:hypothetical protein
VQTGRRIDKHFELAAGDIGQSAVSAEFVGEQPAPMLSKRFKACLPGPDPVFHQLLDGITQAGGIVQASFLPPLGPEFLGRA